MGEFLLCGDDDDSDNKSKHLLRARPSFELFRAERNIDFLEGGVLDDFSKKFKVLKTKIWKVVFWRKCNEKAFNIAIKILKNVKNY